MEEWTIAHAEVDDDSGCKVAGEKDPRASRTGRQRRGKWRQRDKGNRCFRIRQQALDQLRKKINDSGQCG